MTGQFLKVPALIKGLGPVIDTVENHSHEREGLSGLETVSQSLSQQQIAESSLLVSLIDPQPRNAPNFSRGKRQCRDGNAILDPTLHHLQSEPDRTRTDG